MVGSPFAQAGKLPPVFGNVISILWAENMRGKIPIFSSSLYKYAVYHFEEANQEFFKTKTIKMSTQAQAPTLFAEEPRNSQHDNPLRLKIQELQSLRDEMRDIRRDVTNLSNQQREDHPYVSKLFRYRLKASREAESHPTKGIPQVGQKPTLGGRSTPIVGGRWGWLPDMLYRFMSVGLLPILTSTLKKM
ncbi:hypothetical protein M9H77_23759 [Catharanthus roseus]|uniref:Uncharacterized protein n=1 Tax=Catharanthus roseus TaxID=4058 RepID=A0ACC0AUM5_CATRO|nr:hypothetical protein M9H77_23759 [Catharanthus roseus]